jgi:peroxiredoxin
MPGIQRISTKFKDRAVTVFGVALSDKEGDPVGFMRAHGYTYNLLRNGDEIAEPYNASELPTVYLIAPDGIIIHAEHGFRENADVDIAPMIGERLKKMASPQP